MQNALQHSFIYTTTNIDFTLKHPILNSMKRQMNMKNGVKFIMYDALDCSWNFSNGFIIKYKHVLKSSHKCSAAVCEFTGFLSCWVACGFCHSFSIWIKKITKHTRFDMAKTKKAFFNMPCSRDKHQTFLCKLMHICIRMMTTGYHTSLNAYSKLITYALHKSRLKCSLHMRWYVLWSSKDTALSLSLSIAFSLLLSLYLFIELQAIFQHGAHWHRDITFYSLNCVHTHRFRSRRATSAVVWRGIQRPRRKKVNFSPLFLQKKEECTWIV